MSENCGGCGFSEESMAGMSAGYTNTLVAFLLGVQGVWGDGNVD